jgi:hypothetical protein
MKTIYVKRQVFSSPELKTLKNKRPNCNDVNRIIKEDTLVYADGKLVAIYQKVDFDLSSVLSACLHLKFNTYIRQSGLVTQTINLNASPRNQKRDNLCRFSKLRKVQPSLHQIFEDAARETAAKYRLHFKSRYADQVKQSYVGQQRIDANYLIKGTPFTGGVINKDTALGYHFDAANTANGISCMLILKAGVAGGELVLPELDVGFSCQDGYMLLFDGQAYLHGVTKIVKPNLKKGYRYTIVFYNNKGMHLCLPPEEEIIHYLEYLEKQTDNTFNDQNTPLQQ